MSICKNSEKFILIVYRHNYINACVYDFDLKKYMNNLIFKAKSNSPNPIKPIKQNS